LVLCFAPRPSDCNRSKSNQASCLNGGWSGPKRQAPSNGSSNPKGASRKPPSNFISPSPLSKLPSHPLRIQPALSRCSSTLAARVCQPSNTPCSPIPAGITRDVVGISNSSDLHTDLTANSLILSTPQFSPNCPIVLPCLCQAVAPYSSCRLNLSLSPKCRVATPATKPLWAQ
jgi:hypothetical protein